MFTTVKINLMSLVPETKYKVNLTKVISINVTSKLNFIILIHITKNLVNPTKYNLINEI